MLRGLFHLQPFCDPGAGQVSWKLLCFMWLIPAVIFRHYWKFVCMAWVQFQCGSFIGRVLSAVLSTLTPWVKIWTEYFYNAVVCKRTRLQYLKSWVNTAWHSSWFADITRYFNKQSHLLCARTASLYVCGNQYHYTVHQVLSLIYVSVVRKLSRSLKWGCHSLTGMFQASAVLHGERGCGTSDFLVKHGLWTTSYP